MLISGRIVLLIVFVFLISGILFVIFEKGNEEEIEKVNSSESKLDLRIENVLVEENNLILDIKRNQGGQNISGIKFIISDENSSIVFEKFTRIEENGSQKFIFNLSELELGKITNIKIIPFVGLDLRKRVEENFTDSITSDKVNLGTGSKFVEIIEEVNETEEEEETSSSSSGGSSSSSNEEEVVEEEIEENLDSFFLENKIGLFRDLGGFNKTPSEIRDYVNQNYDIENISRDLIVTPSETFYFKKGTEQDVLRMIFLIFYYHFEYNNLILVYEFENESLNQTKYVLNFGGNNTNGSNSGYFYFENGSLEFGEQPSSFWDIMNKEEERRNILIDRFGIFYEGDLQSYNNLTLENVMEWTEL